MRLLYLMQRSDWSGMISHSWLDVSSNFETKLSAESLLIINLKIFSQTDIKILQCREDLTFKIAIMPVHQNNTLRNSSDKFRIKTLNCNNMQFTHIPQSWLTQWNLKKWNLHEKVTYFTRKISRGEVKNSPFVIEPAFNSITRLKFTFKIIVISRPFANIVAYCCLC